MVFSLLGSLRHVSIKHTFPFRAGSATAASVITSLSKGVFPALIQHLRKPSKSLTPEKKPNARAEVMYLTRPLSAWKFVSSLSLDRPHPCRTTTQP